MSSNSERTHLCFNGEILNFRELRRTLLYNFRSEGDTEVILAGYEGYGPDVVQRLVGQFAFCVLSEDERALWLFRDRLGILPLYYWHDADQFVFASEIKALLPAMPTAPRVDTRSLDAYLARRAVPAPWTLFEDVRKLEAGSYMRIGLDGDIGAPRRYWALDQAEDSTMTPVKAAADCRVRLESAVRRNLVADVPVGAYLSGGVDSSLIVALMREIQPRGVIKTFSASFGDEVLDEAPFARQVSEEFRTDHSEIHVSAEDFQDSFPLLTWHRDAPISEASDVAVYFLASAARQAGIKVALSGEGSDELFAGYPKHRLAWLTQKADYVPAGVRSRAAGLVDPRLGRRLWRARTAVRVMGEPTTADRLEAWFAPFTSSERKILLGGSVAWERNGVEDDSSALVAMLRYDMSCWLPDNLLERGDRMSMAASVELRPPFLDNSFVEWAWSVPPHLKLRHGTGKWVVREAARTLLPPSIARRRKHGFRVPVDAWFRGPLRSSLGALLLGDDSYVGSTLNRAAVNGLIDRHQRGTSNEGLRLWTLVALEVWHRVFFRPSDLRPTG